MEAILNFDLSVFRFVENYIWNPVLDVIMTIITYMGEGGVVWIIIALILLFTKKYRKCGVAMALGLIGSLVVVDWIIKPIVERPRPFNLEAWEGISGCIGSSFVHKQEVRNSCGYSRRTYCVFKNLRTCSLSN